MVADFVLKPQYVNAIHWSRRGACGNAGCKDPECCCAFCRLPIGVSEDDPRWDDHEEWCDDCELCRDRVPLILFRGEGKKMEQAQFHQKCAEIVIHFRSACETSGTAHSSGA